MSDTTDSIITAFGALTFEQQSNLVDELRRRLNERWEIEKHTVIEIEVLGGYDQMYDDDQATKRPLASEVIETVRRFHSKQQLCDYLKSIPEDEILWRYRFLHYRFLADGTLWQIHANAHVQHNVASASRLEESGLIKFDH